MGEETQRKIKETIYLVIKERKLVILSSVSRLFVLRYIKQKFGRYTCKDRKVLNILGKRYNLTSFRHAFDAY